MIAQLHYIICFCHIRSNCMHFVGNLNRMRMTISDICPTAIDENGINNVCPPSFINPEFDKRTANSRGGQPRQEKGRLMSAFF